MASLVLKNRRKSKTIMTEVELPIGSNRNLTKSHLLNLCAAGLLACFFFPWMTTLFSRLSGFEFSKRGDGFVLLWTIPLFCVITIVAGVTQQKAQKSIAIFTGILPFIVLALGLYDTGKALIQVLNAAAFISLGLGL